MIPTAMIQPKIWVTTLNAPIMILPNPFMPMPRDLMIMNPRMKNNSSPIIMNVIYNISIMNYMVGVK